MGVCFQEKEKRPPPVKLDETEKAILECKKCRDKIKSLINRLSVREKKSKEKAKDLLKQKEKDRAKFYLRQGKLHQAQQKTYYGQLEMVENQIRQIESSKNLQECMNVLKNGNEVLKKIQDSIKIEEWEKIKDDMDELKEKDKEISSFLQEYGINENEYNQEVEDDLNKLISEIQGNEQLPDVPKEEIKDDNKDNIKVTNKEKKKVILA